MPKNSNRKHFLKFWLPVYVYAGLIFIHSSLSTPPLVPRIWQGDKLLHLLEYAIFGYLIARAAKNAVSLELNAHFRIFAICVAVIYGLSDEFHQYFVPGRQADILDVLADGLGAFLGQMVLKG